MNTDIRPHGIVIADDDDEVRAALEGLLGDHPGLRVLGVAADGHQAAELCGRHRPSVAVVDVRMPYGGTTAIGAIQTSSPDTAIVVYTALADRRTRERLLTAGACKVVVKGSDCDLASVLYELVETLPRRFGPTSSPTTRDQASHPNMQRSESDE